MNIKSNLSKQNIQDFSGYSIDDHIKCVRVSGNDAAEFLQGQFSNDINEITDSSFQISSFSTNQGKVITIIRIFKDTNGFIILINDQMSLYFIKKLSMYILRSDVSISMLEDYKIFAGIGNDIKKIIDFKKINKKRNYLQEKDYFILNNSSDDLTSVIIVSLSKNNVTALKMFEDHNIPILNYNVFLFADIVNKIVRLNSDTMEKYIPQVLNVDSLDGINFKKGCYTGQEIVARTHYLGKIKKKIFLIKHDSKNIRINDKVNNNDDESAGEIISENILVDKKIFCLAILKISSIDEVLVSKGIPLEVVY